MGQIDGMDDSVLDEIDDSDHVDATDPNTEERNKELSTVINIVNTNARSLCHL